MIDCNNKPKTKTSGFTIVELLVVIVVIGILAAITIVSYSGITTRAKIASLQSDLSNSSKQLRMFNVDKGYYPSTVSTDCALSPTSSTNLCLKVSPGNDYTTTAYENLSPQTFTLTATNGNLTYYITENSGPLAKVIFSCPSGFIVVPGSATYGTSQFCVMKYEAKRVGATSVPISEAAGNPWVSISQNDAVINSANVAGCTGCHLITEAEWLTIAQNILSVPSNWSGGSVGSGYVFSGHNDNDPSNALVADVSDANGYSGTNDSSGDAGVTGTMIGNTQRRTLTLTNNEVIWDMAGNVWELTAGQANNSTILQPGVVGNNYSSYIEWNAATIQGTLPVNPLPSFGTPAASGWTSTSKGIGRLLSSTTDTALNSFRRGGHWVRASDSGIFALNLFGAPTISSANVGFRVAR